jgi:hypothetical protein
MSADTLTFIGFLLALAIVAVGVLIAQLPGELTRKRDEYQHIAKIWRIVQYDLLRIREFCLNESKTIEARLNAGLMEKAVRPEEAILQPVKVGHIVTTAWQIAASSGDFITTTNAREIDRLAEIYAYIQVTNEEIDRYIAFYSHYGMVTGYGVKVVSRIEQQYKDIQSLHTKLAADIQNFESTMNHEMKLYEGKARSQQGILRNLHRLGWIAFFALILILICLRFLHLI